MRRIKGFVCIFPVLAIFGLFGYTHNAPPVGGIKSIYIKTVENKVDVAGEISESKEYKSYRPGLEIDITRTIIDRFLYDGNLKIVSRDKADAELIGELINYDRQALRYSTDQTIEEFRVNVVVNFRLVDLRSADNKVLWDASLTGDSSQVTSGKFANTETKAIEDALTDLARRVIEMTFREEW